MTPSLNLTAAEEVLLAAVSLAKKSREFTEWELTVETWRLNKNRWGLRGFESQFPDHKRVMNEIMATGTQKVIGKGWLKRTHPNRYIVTNGGIAKANSISTTVSSQQTRNLVLYDLISPFANNDVFLKYCKDPTEPKTWLGVAAFLCLDKYTKDNLETKINSIKEGIRASLEWIDKGHLADLRRSDSSSSPPITREQLVKLSEFLVAIESKFKNQFEAIRKKE